MLRPDLKGGGIILNEIFSKSRHDEWGIYNSPQRIATFYYINYNTKLNSVDYSKPVQ